MPKYGLVLEGPYDTPVFKAIISRLSESSAEFFQIEAQGNAALVRRLPAFFKILETAFNGVPPDRVFVIQDCDNKQPTEIMQRLRTSIGKRTFNFQYELCIVKRETETWLLSDEGAITTVAAGRNGRAVGYLSRELEQIPNAKEVFREILSKAKLPYTPAVCGEIAATIDLDILQYRCPASREFVKLFKRDR